MRNLILRLNDKNKVSNAKEVVTEKWRYSQNGLKINKYIITPH